MSYWLESSEIPWLRTVVAQSGGGVVTGGELDHAASAPHAKKSDVINRIPLVMSVKACRGGARRPLFRQRRLAELVTVEEFLYRFL